MMTNKRVNMRHRKRRPTVVM